MLPRWAIVHAMGSACVNFRFSGSGLSQLKRAVRLRLAISPRGDMLLPVNMLTVVDGTVRVPVSPSTRSEYTAAVRLFSMDGHEIVEPRGILSHTTARTPSP